MEVPVVPWVSSESGQKCQASGVEDTGTTRDGDRPGSVSHPGRPVPYVRSRVRFGVYRNPSRGESGTRNPYSFL